MITSSIARAMPSSIVALVLVLLLHSCCIVKVAASAEGEPLYEPEPPHRWAVDTFLSLKSVNDELVYVELRYPCGAQVDATTEAFCQEFKIESAECARLAQYVDTEASGGESSSGGDDGEGRDTTEPTSCEPHAEPSVGSSEKLGYIAVNVRHLGDRNEKKTMQLRVAVYRGDFRWLDHRVTRLCEQFQVEHGGCSDLRRHLHEKVPALEMQTATQRIVHADSVKERLSAIETFEAAIRVLQRKNEQLQEIVDKKARQLQSLQWEALATSHDSERRILYLEKKNSELWREKMAARPHEGEQTPSDTKVGTENGSIKKNTCKIPRQRILRVDASNCTYAQYLEFAKSSTPVIFTGFQTSNMTLESIRATCGGAEVVLKACHKATSSSQSGGGSTWAGIKPVVYAKLNDFIDDVTNSSGSQHKPGWPKSYADLYLHDTSIARFCPKLLANITVPRFFTRDVLQEIDIKQNGYWPSLFIGGASTKSGLHADWGSSAAWMALLQGRKRWVIARPSSRAALFERVPTLGNPSEGRFDADLMSENCEGSCSGSSSDDFTSLLDETEVFEDVLEAGEVLFIPADCPHQVRNLDTTVAIAGNFVDQGNYEQFRAFLERVRMTSSRDEYDAYTTMRRQLDRAAQGWHEPVLLS